MGKAVRQPRVFPRKRLENHWRWKAKREPSSSKNKRSNLTLLPPFVIVIWNASDRLEENVLISILMTHRHNLAIVYTRLSSTRRFIHWKETEIKTEAQTSVNNAFSSDSSPIKSDVKKTNQMFLSLWRKEKKFRLRRASHSSKRNEDAFRKIRFGGCLLKALVVISFLRRRLIPCPGLTLSSTVPIPKTFFWRNELTFVRVCQPSCQPTF